MGSMSSGFNPGKVQTSIKAVIQANSELMDCLKNKMAEKFISPMGEAWACKEAVDFFASLKETLDNLIIKSDRVFQSVVDTMNQNAENWARGTESESSFSRIPYHNTILKTDVSMIKENINEERGINESAANSAVDTLAGIKDACDKALVSAERAVSECGFIGESQAENLRASLQDIKQNISDSFGEYTNTTKTRIKETITKYGDIGKTNAKTFISK